MTVVVKIENIDVHNLEHAVELTKNGHVVGTLESGDSAEVVLHTGVEFILREKALVQSGSKPEAKEIMDKVEAEVKPVTVGEIEAKTGESVGDMTDEDLDKAVEEVMEAPPHEEPAPEEELKEEFTEEEKKAARIVAEKCDPVAPPKPPKKSKGKGRKK